MDSKASVEEVRRYVDQRLGEGRFFGEIYDELALQGVPDRTIREAATVHDRHSTWVTLLPPDDMRDDSLARLTRIFTFVAILMLSLLLSMLLKQMQG